ncbi:1-phosphofructokinase family hexose kinase [Aeromicrobium chenweiae]|uniref:1-phosphofructokinase n=1 Tax=Aeromicrobium chenweiae TaxID=2079793 RepID=A0A2S0WK90_9ACTN|nr:1-phosphofructokinase [Aeromicrobium chenweiae]AWB91702.1 1-phosphofructokinase [Aeromicrobium chenweiae]TGN32543.1 1-phosphofructokinase [Aeromicrobium chenweiae]
MIVTLTPNPSIDRTILLSEPLERGAVMRSVSTTDDAGGKGVNVAQVVRNAGQLAVAVLPGEHDDPLLLKLRELRVIHRPVSTGRPSRINLTLAEPNGVTTKINAPGTRLDPAHLDQLLDETVRESAGARWAVLSGSLPPGADPGWYADVIGAIADDGVSIALDTSGDALRLAVERVPHLIGLLKPNVEELAELVGTPVDSLHETGSLVAAGRPLLDAGVGAVLLTCGSRGAALMTTAGTWVADAPPVRARSTVGAGDSALAGYVLGALDGLDPGKRLSLAVAYGSAAVSLPGSTMPSPTDLPPLTEARPWTEG